MRYPEGESDHGPLRPLFDRRLKLEFHGSRVTGSVRPDRTGSPAKMPFRATNAATWFPNMYGKD